MSASTERKQRLAAREAGTDKKTLAQEKEARVKARSKRRWTAGTIAVIVLIAAVLVLNFSLSKATAFSVGGRNFSAAETSYYYGMQYNAFVNQYGSIASYLGLDTSTGIHGLDKQQSGMYDGTWKDYFLESAKNQMTQVTVLGKYAAENGISLDADELAQAEDYFANIEETARSYGYGSAEGLLAANYGDGVTLEMAKTVYRDSALANKAMQALSDSFTYTDEQLEEAYANFNGSHDLFSYAYVYVMAEKVQEEAAEPAEGEDGETDEAPAEGEDGETDEAPAEAPTEETLAEAKKTAEAIAEAYEKAEGELPAERLSKAAAAEGQSSQEETDEVGSSLYFADEWLKDAARKAGDVSVEQDPDGEGWYVVVFLSRNDNHYATANVRHILIKAEADESGSFSDEAKAAAKARAEEILAEYENGEKTEESFAALAEKYSEDPGSNTKGGLYENVPKGQMVPEFDAFCFAGHKSGDTGIVYGETNEYAGYHVMYYVGDGQLYSSSLAETELRNTDLENWMEAAVEAAQAKEGFGMKFVG